MNAVAPAHLIRHASLRQLQVFEAVARNRSYTRAAEELFLSQPTVSMQLKKLQNAVGLPLLENVRKQIHLTDAGEALYAATRQVLDALTRFDMQAADLQGLKTGHLRLAVVTTAKYFAPRVLGAFCRRHPGIDVSLKVTNREALLERLGDNRDDLYVIGRPPEGLEPDFHPILPNPIVMLAHRGHPLVGQRRIPLARIAEEPFILRETGSGTRMAVEAAFGQQGLSPNVRMEMGSNEAIKQAIVGQLGISALSRHTLALEGATGQIQILDVVGFPLERQWHIGFPSGKRPSLVAQAFLDFLEREGEAAVNTTAADSIGISPD